MISVGGDAQYFKVKERMRRDVRAFISLIISDVIQGDILVREDLLNLVMSGAWRSSSERRVVKYESSRSVRMSERFVMRRMVFRSQMNLW